MKRPNENVLTINGGSSSIKFALYEVGESLKRRLQGKFDRIGLSGTNLTSNHPTGKQPESRSVISEQTRLHQVRCNLPARREYTAAMEKA